MKGDPKVIKALQAILPLEAQLNAQCRNDQTFLKFLGVGKDVKEAIKHFGCQAHEFVQIIGLRILILGAKRNYTIGDVADSASLPDLFAAHRVLHEQLMEQLLAGIKVAVIAGDETTAEKLRHVEERHEKAVGWFERQERQIPMVGGAAEYTAEKI